MSGVLDTSSALLDTPNEIGTLSESIDRQGDVEHFSKEEICNMHNDIIFLISSYISDESYLLLICLFPNNIQANVSSGIIILSFFYFLHIKYKKW